MTESESGFRREVFPGWDDLPPPERPEWVVRIAVVGPESVGKTTLSARLAEVTGGAFVAEWARDAFPWADPDYTALPEHMVEICEAQAAAVERAARSAEGWLFSDTEALSTLAWSELYFGHVPDGVVDAAAAQSFDLFLLLDVDVPWVADGTRTWKDHRGVLHRRLRALLESRGLPFVEISGGWEERLNAALAALRRLGAPAAPLGSAGRFPARSEPPSTDGTPGSAGG